jgi:hypothetical protein
MPLQVDQPTPALPPPIAPAPSPLWPQHLADLFVRPTRFFEGQLALGKTPYVILVSWAVGISAAVDRIDTRIMQAELSERPERWRALEFVAGTWPRMWGVVLVAGALSGALYWWLGGWWCKVRLRWSGAPSPDPRLARLLLIYSSFVFAAPAVLALAGQTALYSNYLDAYRNESAFSIAVLVAVFWSLVTTYKGAVALFPVRAGRARLWFIVLPAVFFFLAMGGVAALYSAAAGR